MQVRNMGTIGGSVAHADPAADYPAALQALEAKIVLRSASGERTVTAAEFFVDTFTTALEPGEIVSEIIVPVEARLTGTSYQKFCSPASGFAIVGVAARVRQENGGISLIRVGVTGLSGSSFRADERGSRSRGQAPDAKRTIRAAAALVGDGIEASADLHASAEYRQAPRRRLHRESHRAPRFRGRLEDRRDRQLPFPPERAYDLMQDPVLLAKAIPGCESLEKTGDNEYSLRMKMALASLSGAFDGKVRLTEPDRPTSFRMVVEGSGKIGFMKGDGLLRLTPIEGGTESLTKAMPRSAAPWRRSATA